MSDWFVRNRERIVASILATSLATPLRALADINSSTVLGVPRQFQDLDATITTIFNIVITVAGVAFVVLFLLGGIQYLGGAGNDESTKKARQLMLDAIVGLAIVVVAWAVGTYVLSILGLSQTGIELDPNRIGR